MLETNSARLAPDRAVAGTTDLATPPLEDVGSSRSRPDVSAPLGLVEKLCEELHERGIAYCHWKSNDMLHRSANGENDLDLLIARDQAAEFFATVSGLGFKEGTDAPEKQLPGVASFYGADRETHKIVHIHAHFQLVLGHDFTKNYRIPVEKVFIQSASQEGIFKVPAPEFELAIFVIRMALKHRTWETFLLNHGRLAESELRELDFLKERVNAERLGEVLGEYFPALEKEVFEQTMASLHPATSLLSRLRAGRRIVRCLRPFSRRGRAHDVGLKLWRRVAIPVRYRLLGRSGKARLSSGGLLLAVVGGDGAGKTTAIEELKKWLSQDLDATAVHMGKPNWSATTVLVRGLLKVGRTLGLYPYLRAPLLYTRDTAALTFPGYPWAIRECCTARDRYLTYVRARRIINEGGIVICDRFPLSEIQLMDGPQIRRFAEGRVHNRWIRAMVKTEEYYYERMMRPELLAVLKVDPELAVARKTDESEVTVRPRSSEIWSIDWEKTSAIVVDAAKPKSTVLDELKTLVWSRL